MEYHFSTLYCFFLCSPYTFKETFLHRTFAMLYNHQNHGFSPFNLASLIFWYNFLKIVSCLLHFLSFLKSFRCWFEAPTTTSFLFWIYRLASDLSLFLSAATWIEGIPGLICLMTSVFLKKSVLFSFSSFHFLGLLWVNFFQQ